LNDVLEYLIGVWNLALNIGKFDNMLVFDLEGWKHDIREVLKIVESMLRSNVWKDFVVSVKVWSNKIKLR